MSDLPSSWLSNTRIETEPQLPKVRLTPHQIAEFQSHGEPIPAILKVSVPGYVPAGLSVRTQAGPTLYTVNVPPDALLKLDRDPNVVSIELSQPLGMIK